MTYTQTQTRTHTHTHTFVSDVLDAWLHFFFLPTTFSCELQVCAPESQQLGVFLALWAAALAALLSLAQPAAAESSVGAKVRLGLKMGYTQEIMVHDFQIFSALR